MFLDSKLTFNSTFGTPTAITTTADSAVIDITGAGSGNAPAMINGFPAANTAIGADYGAGDGQVIPHVYLNVTTAGTGAGTITVSVKAAPDDGSYGQGTYTTLVSTRAITGTDLVAGSIIDIPLPPIQYTLAEDLPRFYKLTYTVASTAGVSVLANLVLNPQQSLLGGQYANNYIAV